MTRAKTRAKKRSSKQNGPISRRARIDLAADDSPLPWHYVEVPFPPPPVSTFKSLLGAWFYLDVIKSGGEDRLISMRKAILGRGGRILEPGEEVPEQGPAFRVICGTQDMGPRSERSPRFRKHIGEKGLSDLICMADHQLTKSFARLPVSPKRDAIIKMKVVPFTANRSDGPCNVDGGDSLEPQVVYETRQNTVARAKLRQEKAAVAEASKWERRGELALLHAERAVASPSSPQGMVHDPEEYILNTGL